MHEAPRAAETFICAPRPASQPHAVHRTLRMRVKRVHTCVCVYMFVCDCVGNVCVQASVCQKKETHSKSSVCVCGRERGGRTLSHSAGGKLLSFSFGGGIICISHHSPFSFFPPASLRSRTEARRILEAQRKSVQKRSPPPKAAASTEQQIRALLHRGEAKPAGPRACRSLKWSAASPAMGYLF